MKISVVIPAYNEEAGIAHTIRALLAQDYPDFEIIVVNNASTDRTAEVVRQFVSDSQPPVILVDEGRKGLLWARERGRQKARGEIIANIDADCLPEKDWLARGVSPFKYSHIVAVTGPYDYHDGSRLFRYFSLMTQKYAYKVMSEILQLKPIRNGAILIGGNNLIRADVLAKTGGYNTALVFYGEDTDTAKRVAVHGKAHFDPKLTMKTSARRFKAEGTFRIFAVYMYHFFKTILSKNSKKK